MEPSGSSMIMERYESEIRCYPSELQTSVAVLYAAVRAVSQLNSVNSSSDILNKSNSISILNSSSNSMSTDDMNNPDVLQCHHFIDGLKMNRLQVLGPDATFLSLVQQARQDVSCSSNAVVIECDDNMGMRAAKATDFINTSADGMDRIQGLFDFERQALIRNQISKMLSLAALPMVPEMTGQERSVKETELLSLSSLSASDLHRADQLQLFEKLLRDCVPAPPNFTGTVQKSTGEESSVLKRRYFRNIAAFTLPQILSSDTMREPDVIKKYYPMTDELLLALNWPAPHRRMATESWSPDISAVTVESMKALYGPKGQKPPAEPITPPVQAIVKQAGSANASRRSSADKRALPASPVVMVQIEEKPTALVQHNLTMTPAGNAIIMVKQTTLTQATWLSIYTDGNILGLRYGRLITPVVVKSEEVAAAAVIASEKEKKALEAVAKPEPVKKKGGKPDKKGGKAAKEEKVVVVEEPVALEVVKAPSEKAIVGEGPEGSLTQTLDLHDSYFFCHTEDEVRLVSYLGKLSVPCRKPDRFGTVCLLCLFPSGLQVLMCSNGTVKCHSPTETSSSSSGSGSSSRIRCVDPTVSVLESARIMCPGATVVRHFTSGPYTRDVLSPDGTRTFIKRPTDSPLQSHKGGIEVDIEEGFHSSLLANAPADWTYVRLTPRGSVLFYTCAPGTVPEPRGILAMRAEPTDAPDDASVRMNIRSVTVDAETFSEVSAFEDGRLIVRSKDGLREVFYPDGTVLITHPEGSLVYASKEGLPSMEVDTELDRISGDHSKGIKVPLAKGGDKVRMRIALPDGSAAMIKYDTRITSKVNGSLKLVRRDRTVLLVKDDGLVSYSPRTAWDDEAAAALLADSKDALGGGGGGGYGAGPGSPRNRLLGGQSVTFATTNGAASRSVSPHRLSATDQAVRLTEGGMTPQSVTLSESNFNRTTRSSGGNKFSDSMAESFNRHDYDPSLSVGEPVGQSVDSLNDPLLPLKTTRTKFTMDLGAFTCRVEDHEHNVFDVNLKDPLCPKVLLSGEVEGLKPTAVSVSPMEPRLFIVSRSADAVEVLSTLKASELERVVAICPDAFKTISSVASQPVDLGAGKQHTYHFRRRSNKAGDSYSFSDIFAPRAWQHRGTPATVSMILLRQREQKGEKRENGEKDTQDEHTSRHHPSARTPRTMETMSLIERMPLSEEGYAQLTRDFKRWERYRLDRMKAMDQFQVEDTRSQEELEEEDAIKRQVKVAYKVARAAKSKQRQADREKAKAASQDTLGVPSELALGSDSDVLLEGDDELSDDSDEESVYVDAEEVEVRAAFECYAEAPLSNSLLGDSDYLIQASSLRPAFVQVLNCNVPQQVVDEALEDEGYNNTKTVSLNLDEFRGVLRLVREAIEPKPIDGEDDDDYRDSQGHLQLNTSSYYSNGSEGRMNGGEGPGSPLTVGSPASKGCNRHNERFEKSVEGEGGRAPPSPPPLNFRPLTEGKGVLTSLSSDKPYGKPYDKPSATRSSTDSKKSEYDSNDDERYGDQSGKNLNPNPSLFPVGSAVQAARNRQ